MPFGSPRKTPVATNHERGESRWNAKLTEADVIEIRMLGPLVKSAAIAAMFGVSESNVGLILNRKSWKHIL